MNIKPIIAIIFITAFSLLLVHFILNQTTDCGKSIDGILQGFNGMKSSFCNFVETLKSLSFFAFGFGGLLSLINYFVFNDK